MSLAQPIPGARCAPALSPALVPALRAHSTLADLRRLRARYDAGHYICCWASGLMADGTIEHGFILHPGLYLAARTAVVPLHRPPAAARALTPLLPKANTLQDMVTLRARYDAGEFVLYWVMAQCPDGTLEQVFLGPPSLYPAP